MSETVAGKARIPMQKTPSHERKGVLYPGRILIGIGVCIVWWLLVRFRIADPFFVGSPDAVIVYIYENFTKEIFRHGVSTLSATLIAFSLSGVVGILSGLLLVEFPLFRRLIDPFLTALNSMPRIALAPIFILWFGIGMGSKIALAFSLGFFIVLNNTIAGIRNVDPILMRLSRTLGCSGVQRFWKITLPWAVPSVFAGLKLALVYSFLGVVTSEMIASRVGLGNLVMYYSGIFRMDAVLGILFVMALCAVAITMIADFIESKLVGTWTETAQSARG
jgi:NitT/TauT family transport system permease protein